MDGWHNCSPHHWPVGHPTPFIICAAPASVYPLKQVCIYIIISLRQHLNKTTTTTTSHTLTREKKTNIRTKMQRVASTRWHRMHTQINKHHHPVRACVCRVSAVFSMHVVFGPRATAAHARARVEMATRETSNLTRSSHANPLRSTRLLSGRVWRVWCRRLSSSSSPLVALQSPRVLLFIVVRFFFCAVLPSFIFSFILFCLVAVVLARCFSRRGSETATRVKLARSVRTAQRSAVCKQVCVIGATLSSMSALRSLAAR